MLHAEAQLSWLLPHVSVQVQPHAALLLTKKHGPLYVRLSNTVQLKHAVSALQSLQLNISWHSYKVYGKVCVT